MMLKIMCSEKLVVETFIDLFDIIPHVFQLQSIYYIEYILKKYS